MTNDKRRSHLFKPGQSGNPSGRSKASYEVANLAKKYTKEAIFTLGEIMNNTQTPSAVRVAAAEALLNRAWGKPMISVQSQSIVDTFQGFIQQRLVAEERYQEIIKAESEESTAITEEVVEVKESPELTLRDLI